MSKKSVSCSFSNFFIDTDVVDHGLIELQVVYAVSELHDTATNMENKRKTQSHKIYTKSF